MTEAMPPLGAMPESFDYHPPTEPWLSIIHLDDDLVVLDKPSGLLSVPGRDPALSDSLAKRVQARFPGSAVTHRLDKDTSGVLVMARNKRALAHVGQEFEQRRARKAYVARVWGDVAGESGEIDLPLATDWENKPRQRVDHEAGRASRTRWQVIGREAGVTRLQLEPLTGRTHQLRVHLRAIGHPILGDVFYATGEALAAADRLQLHAHWLEFAHPGDGHVVRYEAPLPF
ncbi:ribosomal large subunit pseudouridine synthase A [Devosia enhydra]|uniref:Ribosomal large subunit pseudouridine synthase A n=1 Tax=Devosia enhydra TaxID=665118 RepID=A0A1K2I372_9HYPH|nr:pseudouridine synthase [Devosia enhydra]SFZ86838.1 ribosomal large subunit pseudouridine synthase A [Devosia enhydra]